MKHGCSLSGLRIYAFTGFPSNNMYVQKSLKIKSIFMNFSHRSYHSLVHYFSRHSLHKYVVLVKSRSVILVINFCISCRLLGFSQYICIRTVLILLETRLVAYVARMNPFNTFTIWASLPFNTYRTNSHQLSQEQMTTDERKRTKTNFVSAKSKPRWKKGPSLYFSRRSQK